MLPDTTSRTTTDHDEIRRWASERGAKPATLACPGTDAGEEKIDQLGMLHLDVPGFDSQQPRHPMDWEEWFQQFEEHKLALPYQEQTPAGELSNFNKIVTRAKVEKVEDAVGGQGRSASSKNSGNKNATKKTPVARKLDSGVVAMSGRERTAQKSESAREKSASSGRASTKSRSAEEHANALVSGGAVRGSQARHSRTTQRGA
jgi:hypothetical protein